VTPLWVASSESHLEVVKWLVEESNAEVDNSANDGETLLDAVKYIGNEEIVKCLEGKGSKE
jgi:hypothetical protein